MAGYHTPVDKNPIAGGIVENYCGGVFISPEQVHKLLSDYEKDIQIKILLITSLENIYQYS